MILRVSYKVTRSFIVWDDSSRNISLVTELTAREKLSEKLWLPSRLSFCTDLKFYNGKKVRVEIHKPEHICAVLLPGQNLDG